MNRREFIKLAILGSATITVPLRITKEAINFEVVPFTTFDPEWDGTISVWAFGDETITIRGWHDPV